MTHKKPAHRRVEIIIVTIVLIALAWFAIPYFFKAKVVSNENLCHRNIAEIAKDIEVYQLAYDESLPLSLDDVYGAGKTKESMPVCPFGGAYKLDGGKVVCDHELKNATP